MNLRETIGLTREALAEAAHMSEKFLYEIEVGKKGFSVETLKKLAKALNVSCDYIIFGTTSSQHDLSKLINVVNKYDSGQVDKLAEILESIYDISNKK